MLLMCTYCFVCLLQYKSKLNIQTTKLVQLYLDKQFITRIFRMLAGSKDDSQSFFEIIANIKEYFQLDDIMFFNASTKPKIDVSPGVFKRNIITGHVKQNLKQIVKSLELKKMAIEEIDIEKLETILYIVALEDDAPDTLVIFVRYGNDKLDSSDLETLSNSIKLILSVMEKKQSFVK